MSFFSAFTVARSSLALRARPGKAPHRAHQRNQNQYDISAVGFAALSPPATLLAFFLLCCGAQPSGARAMLYLVLKAGLSGVIIAAASELARRAPALGALILSLPLISLLAFVWLWRDTSDNTRIAALSEFDVLVCAADAADVPRAAGAAASWRRLLDGIARLLHADLRALSADGLDAGQIRRHALSKRKRSRNTLRYCARPATPALWRRRL